MDQVGWLVGYSDVALRDAAAVFDCMHACGGFFHRHKEKEDWPGRGRLVVAAAHHSVSCTGSVGCGSCTGSVLAVVGGCGAVERSSVETALSLSYSFMSLKIGVNQVRKVSMSVLVRFDFCSPAGR